MDANSEPCEARASNSARRGLRALHLKIAVMSRRGLRTLQLGTAVMQGRGLRALRLGHYSEAGTQASISRLGTVVMLRRDLQDLRLSITRVAMISLASGV